MQHNQDAGPADLDTVLADPLARRIWVSLRRAPLTAEGLMESLGLDRSALQRALHPLIEAGLVVVETPALGARGSVYRWDGGALTGIRAWGRRRRRRSPVTVAASGVDAGGSDPIPAGAQVDAAPGTLPGASVAAWTNPAVRAALRRLEAQSAHSSSVRSTHGPADGDGPTRRGTPPAR